MKGGKKLAVFLIAAILANFMLPFLPIVEKALAEGNVIFEFNPNTGTFDGRSNDVKANPNAVRYVTVGWTITRVDTNGNPLAHDHGIMLDNDSSPGFQVREEPANAKPGDPIRTFFSVPRSVIEQAIKDADLLDIEDGYTVYISSVFRIENSPKNAGKLFYTLNDILAAENWSAETRANLRERFDNAVTYYSPVYEGNAIIRLVHSDSTVENLPAIPITTGKAGKTFSYTFEETIQHNGKTYVLYKSYIQRKLMPGEERYPQYTGDPSLRTRNTTIAVGGTTIIGVYREQSQKPDLEAISITNLNPVVSGQTVNFRAEFFNNGAAIPSSQQVVFRITNASGTTLKQYTKNGVASGETVTVDFSSTFTTAPQTFTATADPNNAIDESNETNNSVTRSFTPVTYAITGDFDILPSNTITYRDSFTLRPKNFVIPSGCTYQYHEYRIQKDGFTWTSPRVTGQTADTSYTYASYPPNVGVGSNYIQIRITAVCGTNQQVVDSGWTAGKYLYITSPANNRPPQFSAGFFKEYNRTGWVPDTEVVVGTRVNLRIIHDPTKEPPWPFDPDGDPIAYTWLFESSDSAWIRSLPSQYGLSAHDEAHYNLVATVTGRHSVTVIGRDPFGAETRYTATINVIPENPIPIIDGPTEVKENRPLPKPFDGSRSYSPIGRAIVEYQWENRKDRYTMPGVETIRLHVVDSAGLRSLSPAVHLLTVLPDEPPVAVLEADPLAIREQAIDIFNKSHSPDGDKIVSATYRIRYDRNNNGFDDDAWQPLAGNLAKTELVPDKVGKYEVEVTVTEDYGKQGTSSIVVDVVNLAPSVSFRIEGKNEQPAPENKRVYDAATILNSWSLYRVNSTTPITGKLQRWQNENGRLTGLLGRGMENLSIYNTHMFDTGNYQPVMAIFQDYGYGNNGISPYRAMRMNDPAYSQPLPVPVNMNANPQLAELTYDTDWSASYWKQIENIATNPKYLYLVRDGYLLALNKNKIGTYHFETHDTYSTHHWHNGSPYDFILKADDKNTRREVPNVLKIKTGYLADYWRTLDPSLLNIGSAKTNIYPEGVGTTFKVGPRTIYQFSTITMPSSSSFERYVWELVTYDALSGEKIANSFESGFFVAGVNVTPEFFIIGDDLVIAVRTAETDVYMRLNRRLELVYRFVLDVHREQVGKVTFSRELYGKAFDENGNLYQLYRLECSGSGCGMSDTGMDRVYMEKIDLANGRPDWRIQIGDKDTSWVCSYGVGCKYRMTEDYIAAPIVVNHAKKELLIRYFQRIPNGMEARYMAVSMADGSTRPMDLSYRSDESTFYVDHAGNYVSGITLDRTPFSYTAEGNVTRHASTSGPGGTHQWSAGGNVELYSGGMRYANPSTSIWRIGFYIGDGLYLSFHPDSSTGWIDYRSLIPWITKGTPTASQPLFNPSDLGQFVSGDSADNAEFAFTMRMALPEVDTNTAGFSFRMADPRNRYAVETDGATLVLAKYVGGSRTVLDSIAFTWQADREYAIRIVAEGSRIRVFVGGVPYFDVTDGTFASGTYGPFSSKPYADFSGISRKRLAEPHVEWLAGYAIWEEGTAKAEVRYTNIAFEDPEHDPPAGRYRWTIEHTPKFLNDQGTSSLHGRTFTTPVAEFDKVGLYRVTLRAQDDPHPDYPYPSHVFAEYRKDSNDFWQLLVVHRRPVAEYTITAASDGTLVWNDTSYDPDRWLSDTRYSTENTGIDYRATRGILERRYYYVTPSGQRVEQKLVAPAEAGTYRVGLQVKDEYGAWSHWNEQTVTVLQLAPPNEPPKAGFTVTPSTGHGGTVFTITSTAWDKEDGPAANLQHAYYIRNLAEGTPETLQSTSRGTWTKTFSSLGVMEIRQVVTDSKGATDQYVTTVVVQNRQPAANFSWTPQPPREGDTVRFRNASTDPDGDPLTHEWHIRDANGALLHASADVHPSFRFLEPGHYLVTLRVSDGLDRAETTRTVQVLPLTLEADVGHAPEWLAHHEARGHRTAEAPKQFYSGELILLYARHDEAPWERITAKLETTGADGRPLAVETSLVPSGTPGLAVGELYDERFSSIDRGLPRGIHHVAFTIRYANGMEKTAVVPFEIIGHALETVQVHRVR